MNEGEQAELKVSVHEHLIASMKLSGFPVISVTLSQH